MARFCIDVVRSIPKIITCCAILAAPIPALAQTTIFSESFDSAWTTPTTLQSSTCSSPPCFWNGEGSGDTEWHRNNYTIGWTGSGGSYSPGGANGTLNSARFNSSDAPLGAQGALLSPYFQIFGTEGPLAFSFWVHNASGTDSVHVSVTNDGFNYRRVLSVGTATTWTKYWANLGPAGGFSSMSIKIEGVSDDGTTDIGIDEVAVRQGLAGTTLVGPGERLQNLTEAVAEYDSATAVLAPAAYKLTAGYQGVDTELLPLTLLSIPRDGGNHTVTFGPNTGVTATTSGSSASGVFVLDGADYIVLEGGSGWNVTNTNIAGATAGVWLRQGASNDTVRNLTISCGVDPRSSNLETFGIISSGAALTNSSDGTNNDANTFAFNTITNVQWGIYCRGAIGNPNDNVTIRGNTVGPATLGPGQIRRGGIIAQHQNAISILDNLVRGIGLQSTDAALATDAIAVGGGSNVSPPAATAMTNGLIARNEIHTILNGKALSAIGIIVASSVSPSINTVTNNVMRNILGNSVSPDHAGGISIGLGSGDRIAYNSLRLYGDLDGVTSATQSAVGIRVASAAAANLTVKNNVIAVGWTSNTGTLRHYCEVVPSAGFSWGTGGNNNNDYWVDPISSQATLGGLGTVVPYTPVTSLASWRTQFTPNQDGASINTSPPFVSTINLHIQTGIPTGIESGGTPIAGVVDDKDGQLRNVSTPDIGMDEGNFTPLIANFPPVFREHADIVPRWGRSMVISPLAHDKTCLPLTYSATGLPPGASINPTNGRITWNVAACPGSSHGSLTVFATDSCGLSDTLTVGFDPRPPVLTSCYVRPEYVPKCTSYPADARGGPGIGIHAGDFIEDQLLEMTVPPGDSIPGDVWLIFNQCHALEGDNRDSVSVYARILWEPSIVPAVLVRTVQANLDNLAGMYFVSIVTANHRFGEALTTTGQVLGIRPSPTYSPSTVEDSLFTVDGTGATVVIMDSGVDGTHESLVAKQASGISFISGTGDSISGDPVDINGHGTASAGAAVGRGSGLQNIGMAKASMYADVAVLADDGMFGQVGIEADVLAGLQYALANYPSGTIVYLGIEGDPLSYGADPSVLWNGTDLLSTTINAVTQLGLVVVVPVGNTDLLNTPLLPPAVAEDAIVVAASAHMNTVLNTDDEIAPWSKVGPREPDPDGDTVDEQIPHVTAPGTDLPTGGAGIMVPWANTGNQYVGVQGTSVAAAHVAGVVALMQQVTAGSLSTWGVKQMLMELADEIVPPMPSPSDRPSVHAAAWGAAWGHGLVNAFRVMDRLVPAANLGFDVFCWGSGDWYYSPDIEVLDPILLGDSVRVRVQVHNKSLQRRVIGYTVEVGAYSFGSGPFQGVFHTFVETDTLEPNASKWLESKWYVNPGLEKPHGCLKAFINYARDGATFDNCAQRNVDIIGYGSSNLVANPPGLEPLGIAAPPPVSRMFVANVMPSNVDVTLIPTMVLGSGWTLVSSETTLAFSMDKNEAPREVTFRGVPGSAATDSAMWSINVMEGAECAAWSTGGGMVVARKTELTDVEDDVIVGLPTLVMAPRPFRRSLDITFGLPRAGEVGFRVFDVMGREVWRIDLGVQPAGRVHTQWDGRTRGGADAAPGVYFVRARMGGVEIGGRVVRLK